jgi:hypothetical protein
VPPEHRRTTTGIRHEHHHQDHPIRKPPKELYNKTDLSRRKPRTAAALPIRIPATKDSDQRLLPLASLEELEQKQSGAQPENKAARATENMENKKERKRKTQNPTPAAYCYRRRKQR